MRSGVVLPSRWEGHPAIRSARTAAAGGIRGRSDRRSRCPISMAARGGTAACCQPSVAPRHRMRRRCGTPAGPSGTISIAVINGFGRAALDRRRYLDLLSLCGHDSHWYVLPGDSDQRTSFTPSAIATRYPRRAVVLSVSTVIVSRAFFMIDRTWRPSRSPPRRSSAIDIPN